MTEKEHCRVLAANWLDKAEESLSSAKIMYDNGLFISCVNRLYYAAFYAMCAILAYEDKSYGKHSTVRAAVHRDLVKPGLMPEEYGAIYDTLFEDRQEGDYTPTTNFSAEDLQGLLSGAEKIVVFAKEFVVRNRSI